MQAYPWPFLVNTSSIAQQVRYPNSKSQELATVRLDSFGNFDVSYVFRYLDDVALHHLVDALCRLSSTSMEQAQSNKVTEKFRVNFMALVRSIFNLEMFSRGFQVLDSLLHSLPPYFLLVYYCLLRFVQSKRNNTYCRSFQEPSLFAVAKLLETGLNNLHRARVLWKPLTAHLLEVSFFTATKKRKLSFQPLPLQVLCGCPLLLACTTIHGI